MCVYTKNLVILQRDSSMENVGEKCSNRDWCIFKGLEDMEVEGCMETF